MKSTWFVLLAAALLPCATAVTAVAPPPADSWPEFRGPAGEGRYNGTLPTEWGSDKNVAWKQEIPGKGWSSPVVVDGKVYVTTAAPIGEKDGKELSLRALCLDAANGKTLWDKEVFQEGPKAPGIHGKNSHASPTPLVRDGRVYVHFGHQGTASLDLDGKVIWTNNDLKYAPVHGNGGSPVLVDDALIFSCDGGADPFIVALGKADGKVLWKTERNLGKVQTFSFGTPLVITVKGKKQVVSPASSGVCAYEPATGKEIWRVTYRGYSVIPRPAFAHGMVILSTGFDQPKLLAIRADGEGEGEGEGDVTKSHVAWTLPKHAPHTPSPLVVGDELYLVSDAGKASCLDAKTGEVHWQEDLGGHYSASPICAGDKVYIQSEEGVGVVFAADKRFKLLAKNDLDERSLASYAAADGALFIRTEKHLYRVQAK
jgi:outer membrane protein assembly factor BamB